LAIALHPFLFLPVMPQLHLPWLPLSVIIPGGRQSRHSSSQHSWLFQGYMLAFIIRPMCWAGRSLDALQAGLLFFCINGLPGIYSEGGLVGGGI
jgi:hypothetical protein